jgi:hypothetical protein
MVRSGRCRLRRTAATGERHGHRSRYRMLRAAPQRRCRNRRRMQRRRHHNRLRQRNRRRRRPLRHHLRSAWRNLRYRFSRRRKCRRRRDWIEHSLGALHVIASQRVGAMRRPMTGSAKQSNGHAKTGLLRRCAPRNDGKQKAPRGTGALSRCQRQACRKSNRFRRRLSPPSHRLLAGQPRWWW